MSSIVHSSVSSSQIIDSFEYGRDANGNRTSIRSPAGLSTYNYDTDSQLVSATPAESTPETYAYDQVFNRIQDVGGAYTYDSKAQELKEDYRSLYAYDKNGNLISKQAKGLTGEVTNYEYNSENQLIHVQVFHAGSSTPAKEAFYAYDALGRRIQRQVIDHSDPTQSFTRRYVYDGDSIDLEYDGSNALLARYTHSGLAEDDVLAAEVTDAGSAAGLARASGSYQYIKDAQGSVIDVADANGNKLQHYIYNSFGSLLSIRDAAGSDVTSSPPVATPFSFTGREYDPETRLYYYRARYYDPGTGRFLQRDPEPGNISQPNSEINSYTFTENSPQTLRDPTGRFVFIIALLIAAAVSGAISAVAHGVVTGDWSLGGLAESFAIGFSSAVAVGALGFLGGFLAAGLGATGVVAWLTGAAFGSATGAFLGALENPQNHGLGALFGGIGGFFGGGFAGGSAFNLVQTGAGFGEGLVSDLTPQIEANPNSLPEAPPYAPVGNIDKLPLDTVCTPGLIFDSRLGRCVLR